MEHKVIYSLLNADATYKAACGTDATGNVKVYPIVAPQGTNMPYAVVNTISPTREHSKDERGVSTPRVQVDHYGNTAEQAEELAELCLNVLDHYKGTVAGVSVSSIRELDGSTGYQDDTKSKKRITEFSMRINP